MTVRINKQKINLREKLTEFEDKVNFDEVVRGLGEYTGNVGIGTTDPEHKLKVTGTVKADRFYDGSDGTHFGSLVLYDASGDTVFDRHWSSGETNFIIKHAGVAQLVVKEGGNVGIGTTNPDVKLDIQGNSNLASKITLTRTDVGRTAVLSANADSPACPFVGSQSNSDFAIYTNNSAKMLIDTSGNVGIGTTNPGYKLSVEDNAANYAARFYNANASASGLAVSIASTSAGSLILNCLSGNFSRFSVRGDGVAITNGSTVTSDDRVKHNEQTIVGAIETLGKLTPKKYIKTAEMYEANHDFELDTDGNPVDENGEPVEHTVEAGVIAQQVLGVPELAFMVSPEGVDEDGNVTSPHGLNYNSLFTYAIAAIQEQQAIIEDLKSRIETLESK